MTTNPGGIVRIALVEDQFLLREGISRLLSSHGIEVPILLSSLDGLDAALQEHEPDLVIFDIRLPPSFTDEGLRAAVELRDQNPGSPVLLLSQHVEHLYLQELLRTDRGGVGYLLKDRVFDDLQFVNALRKIAAGGTVVDPEVVASLRARNGHRDLIRRLTPREYEVLAAMAEGDTNSRIAERMVITEKAVAKHINSLFAKLDLPPGADSARRVRAVLTFLKS